MSRTRRAARAAREDRSGVRFYCPSCGQVRGTSRWSNFNENEHNGVDRVFAHDRNTGIGTAPVVKCPGGTVDPEKDRAP